jgi:RNA polymerase sigma-70 factor (ECF subfamily)
LRILARTPVEGPYALQARIAAGHATAVTPADTDWRSIALWYDELARVQPTPVVELNRAVAHGYAFGPASGLELLKGVQEIRDDYPMVIAVEADLTARAGDRPRAAALFREAAAATPDGPERRALLTRAAEL